ncbi:MAG: hypothetical protein WC249_02640 [Patescibacteria group bacterium]|jgi:hypothetical protein
MFKEKRSVFNPGLEKGKVDDETAAAMGELIFLGQKTGNNLKFREAGLNADLSELIKTTKIKTGIAKDLSEKDLELMKSTVGILISFIMAPIFTDDFGLDHESRIEWEKKAGLRNNGANGQISDSAKKYYHADSLGFNRCSSATKLISDLAKDISDPELKIDFQKLVKIPPEFVEKDENNNIQYHGLDDEEKIRVVNELKSVARNVVFFLKV